MRSLALWLSLVLIFTIPWENAITISGLGTFTRFIGLVLIVVWVLSVLVRGKFRKPRPFHLAFFIFVLINIISVLWTYDLLETQQRIITYLQLFAFAIILWDLFATQPTFKLGLQAYVLGAYITIGSTLNNYLNGKTISNYEIGRYSGAELNANDLALILALGLPIAWHLAISMEDGKKKRILGLLNYAFIPLAIFSIILTASRMSLFALIPAIVYILVTLRQIKTGIRIVIFILLTGIMFIMQNYIPQASLERLATTGASIANLDLGNRVAIWYEAMAVFFAHPLLGVGSGALRTFIGGAAHNTFISILCDLGILGFISFLFIMGTVVYQAIHQPKINTTLWLTILTIWVIGVSTLTWEVYKPTWLFMSLIILSASLFSIPKSSSMQPGVMKTSIS